MLDLLCALGKLNYNQREVWIDRHIIDRPIADIAATLGKTPNAVIILDRRAKKKLAKLLARPVVDCEGVNLDLPKAA